MLGIPYLLKISRPRFWVYIFGPYIIGLIAGANQTDALLDWKVGVYALFFLFPANLLIYGVNDIFDYETDALNDKKTNYETLVKPDKRKPLFLVITVLNLPFIVLSLFLGTKAIIAMFGFLFFSIFYSAPPIRAKIRPFLDSLFNVLYIFPGIFGYVLLAEKLPSWQIILSAGLWAMAMHAYSAIPDIEADRQANLKTIATELGATATLALCSILYVSSALIALPYIGILAIFLGIVFAVMIAISFHFNKTNRLFAVYKFFPIINSISGFLLFWQIALSRFDILK